MKSPATLTILFLAALFSAAFAQRPSMHGHDRQWKVPRAAAEKANPLASRRDALNGGEKLYRQRCMTCHGEDGMGGSRAPALAAADVAAQSDGALFWKIGGGNTRSGMPSFSFLPEPQRWQLVLFLRSLAPAQ